MKTLLKKFLPLVLLLPTLGLVAGGEALHFREGVEELFSISQEQMSTLKQIEQSGEFEDIFQDIKKIQTGNLRQLLPEILAKLNLREQKLLFSKKYVSSLIPAINCIRLEISYRVCMRLCGDVETKLIRLLDELYDLSDYCKMEILRGSSASGQVRQFLDKYIMFRRHTYQELLQIKKQISDSCDSVAKYICRFNCFSKRFETTRNARDVSELMKEFVHTVNGCFAELKHIKSATSVDIDSLFSSFYQGKPLQFSDVIASCSKELDHLNTNTTKVLNYNKPNIFSKHSTKVYGATLLGLAGFGLWKGYDGLSDERKEGLKSSIRDNMHSVKGTAKEWFNTGRSILGFNDNDTASWHDDIKRVRELPGERADILERLAGSQVNQGSTKQFVEDIKGLDKLPGAIAERTLQQVNQLLGNFGSNVALQGEPLISRSKSSFLVSTDYALGKSVGMIGNAISDTKVPSLQYDLDCVKKAFKEIVTEKNIGKMPGDGGVSSRSEDFKKQHYETINSLLQKHFRGPLPESMLRNQVVLKSYVEWLSSYLIGELKKYDPSEITNNATGSLATWVNDIGDLIKNLLETFMIAQRQTNRKIKAGTFLVISYGMFLAIKNILASAGGYQKMLVSDAMKNIYLVLNHSDPTRLAEKDGGYLMYWIFRIKRLLSFDLSPESRSRLTLLIDELENDELTPAQKLRSLEILWYRSN